MKIHSSLKKTKLIIAIICHTLFSMAHTTNDLFDAKWTLAQEYLKTEALDKLPALITEMSTLVKKDQITNQAKLNYLQGEYWHYQEEWQKGINYLDQTIEDLIQDPTNQLLLAEAYLVKGYCLHELEELDETLFSYNHSLKLKQKVLGRQHLKVSNLYFNIGYIYQEKRDLLSSDEAFQEGLDILSALYPKENEKFADFYEELGYNQSAKGDFHGAIKYLQKALLIKENIFGKNGKELIFTYKYLGESYYEDEYYGKAVNYAHKALEILEQQSEKDTFEEGMINFRIGKSYLKLKEYGKADAWFKKALKIDKQNKFLLPEIHRLRGEIASEEGEVNIAENHFKQAINGFENDLKNNEAYLIVAFESITKHLFSVQKNTKALTYINKGLKFGKSVHKDQPNKLFKLYKNKGYYFQTQKDYKKAKLYYKKAQNSIGGEVSWEDASLAQLKNKIILNEEYANLFLSQAALSSSPRQNLLKADSIFSTTINLINYLTKNYREQSTKENFIEESYKVFKKAIDLKYQLYQITNEDKYLEEAFLFSEKSKNLILLETLKNITAFKLSGVPTTILNKENKLKTNITYLENKRFEENQQSKIDQQLIKKLNSSLFDLKEQYEKLVYQIEQDYPEYYQLKFAQNTLPVKRIQQKLLANNQSIIEYFITDSHIYTFLIKKDTFKVFKLEKPKGLEEKVNQFRTSLYSYRPPSLNETAINNDSLISVTNQSGLFLYESLLKPFKNELTKKITIIADGVLGYLPFDALITKLTISDKGKVIPSYLMYEHLISFAHSVDWLSGLYNDNTAKFDQNFVGIAPLFKATGNDNAISDFRLGLGPLKYNQTEVENIKNSVGGKVIKGIKATRAAFLSNLQNGQILHLATHGKSNDEQGDYSYLAFSEPRDHTDNQFLYVKDLFNLKIPADLVVLSACETGLGELKRGEGIVGIGKGFSYAGAKSLVTTLWRVSDNSTANFMPIFYRNLKDGLSKDEALWKAKKEFIQTYRTTTHPFFWSGYVAYGNMEPIQFQHSNTWSTQLILGVPFIFCALCLIIYLSFFKRQTI